MLIEKEVSNVYINPYRETKNGMNGETQTCQSMVSDPNASKTAEKSDQVLYKYELGKI